MFLFSTVHQRQLDWRALRTSGMYPSDRKARQLGTGTESDVGDLVSRLSTSRLLGRTIAHHSGGPAIPDALATVLRNCRTPVQPRGNPITDQLLPLYAGRLE